jgi:hypothetical protein
MGLISSQLGCGVDFGRSLASTENVLWFGKYPASHLGVVVIVKASMLHTALKCSYRNFHSCTVPILPLHNPKNRASPSKHLPQIPYECFRCLSARRSDLRSRARTRIPEFGLLCHLEGRAALDPEQVRRINGGARTFVAT